MKRTVSWLVLLALVLFIAIPLIGQETAAPAEAAAAPKLELDEAVADYNPYSDYPTIWDIVISSGVFGVAIWFGIFLWALASIPLGILSIVHSARRTVHGWPLTTKLLIVGGIWVLILGFAGFVQGIIYSLFCLATMHSGMAEQAMLALNVAQALYSLQAALLVCQAYLFFLLISLVILHFKHRKVPA